MMRNHVALALAAAVACTACSSTGGIILGLFPAPKFLAGDIEDSVYTAKNGTFSIAVPHEQGTYEYRYLVIKEEHEENGIYVSFGPGAFDRSIYRIEIAWTMSGKFAFDSLDDITPLVIHRYEEQLRPQGGPLRLADSRDETINGRDARYLLLTQVLSPENPPGYTDLTHEVYVIDMDVALAIVWVQMFGDAPSYGITPRAFAESFVLHAAGPP